MSTTASWSIRRRVGDTHAHLDGAALGVDRWRGVFAIEHGRAVRRDVTLGIRGEGAVEIESNLREGAEVVVSNGRALAPGQRVRARRQEP
jgi:hypothetical protein